MLFAAHEAVFLTREIFGNVSAWSKFCFYVLAAAALSLFAWGIRRRMRLWRLGRPTDDQFDWKTAAGNVARNVLLQRRVRGRGAASVAHSLLFGGFVILFVGTVLVAVEHVLASALGRSATDPVFHRGAYFAVFEIALDTAGLAFLTGCVLFAVRRSSRPRWLGHEPRDWLVLGLFFAIGVTGFLLEGLRIVREQTALPGLSYVGYAAARGFEALGVTPMNAGRWHAAGWWLHAVLSLGLIGWFPWCRLLHAVAGAVRLAAGVDPLGTLPAVSLEEFEMTGEIGAARIDRFTRRQLLELDACVSCGRCEQACPAFEAGKPLSPRDVVQDLRQHMESGLGMPGASHGDNEPAPERPIVPGGVIAAETIWSCTTCSACVDVCPLGVNPLGFLTEMRRHLVADSQLRGPPAAALERSGRSGNPWGLPAQDRVAWAEGLDVPTVTDNPNFEVLYWVGCAAAYDRRLQRVAQSMVKLLRAAGVDFAVLGRQERCTGEAARRMGDEFLFQQLAETNRETFERSGATQASRRVVTHCPHCLNSFQRDYPQMGVRLNVVHHTEFLKELIRDGRLRVPQAAQTAAVTYHDPCYLSRVSGVTAAPRELVQLAAGKGSLTEMPRHGRQTACCGAGGGRMWFDDAPDTRIGRSRVDEALATGAGTLAVACPFCLIMTSDGIAARGSEMTVRDIAEILADTLPG